MAALFENHLMKTILRAAAEGGKIVKRYFRSRNIEVREKSVPGDMAAGVLIVAEAGGRVSSLSGSDFRLEEGGIAASNGLIHAELVRSVNGPSPTFS